MNEEVKEVCGDLEISYLSAEAAMKCGDDDAFGFFALRLLSHLDKSMHTNEYMGVMLFFSNHPRLVRPFLKIHPKCEIHFRG